MLSIDFFKQMYFDIWQSHAIERFDDYYASDFQETIDTSDSNQQPLTLSMDYIAYGQL